MDTCHFFAGQTADALSALGERCLVEPASRRLDADIHCALHGIRDFNPLDTDALVQAHEDGRILVRLYHDGQFGWIEAPAFTADLDCAIFRQGLPLSIAIPSRSAPPRCTPARSPTSRRRRSPTCSNAVVASRERRWPILSWFTS